MPINPALLIAAPMLQDYLVDKDGTPMSNGTITCFQDNSRTTLKNWYYQSSNSPTSNGQYTFSALPNPLTLSAAGTICDINGVDTIPFFYPYSELDDTVAQPYYIVIENQYGTNQITRANFPYNPSRSGPIPPSGGGNLENYIINNGFWRNVGTLNLTNVLQTIVAPSQHDGFSMPDIQFIKNVTGGEDTVTFTKFPLTDSQALTGDITPEFYINHTCSNVQSGETFKYYQFPVSLHVNTLNAVEFTFTIQAQNIGGSGTGQNVINLVLLQFTGTGTTSPVMIPFGTITLNTQWTKYEFTFTTPSTAGLILGNGADDAIYIQVQMPVTQSCSINFTKPSFYLSNAAPTNSFETYDQVDTVINSPRTGDIRTSINSWWSGLGNPSSSIYYAGWVAMNNGTIGSSLSNATTRANSDAWPLYNLLWNLAKPYDSGSGPNSNPICQMYSSAGAPTTTFYGANAYTDFNTNNNQLSLTQMLGNVIMGTVPAASLLSAYNTLVTSVTSGGGKILITLPAAPPDFYIGQPVTFTATVYPTNIVANAIYYVANPNSGAKTFNVATSFANALVGTTIAYATSGTAVTAILQTSGATIGESQHTLSVAELAQHTHNPLSPANEFVTGGTGTGVITGTLGTIGVSATTGNVTNGSGVGHNTIQLSTLYNIYMKL